MRILPALLLLTFATQIPIHSAFAESHITEIIDATGLPSPIIVESPLGVAVDNAGSSYFTASLSNMVYRVDVGGFAYVIIDATGDGVGNPLDGPQPTRPNH